MKNRKIKKEEIGQLIFDETRNFTQAFFESYHKDLDRELWGALHVGMVAGLLMAGYKKKVVNEGLAMAQSKLKVFYKIN